MIVVMVVVSVVMGATIGIVVLVSGSVSIGSGRNCTIVGTVGISQCNTRKMKGRRSTDKRMKEIFSDLPGRIKRALPATIMRRRYSVMGMHGVCVYYGVIEDVIWEGQTEGRRRGGVLQGANERRTKQHTALWCCEGSQFFLFVPTDILVACLRLMF